MPARGTLIILPHKSNLSSKTFIFRSNSFKICNIPKALAENILGIGDDEECVFVDTLYHLPDIGYLRALDNAQQHLLILMRICALSLKNGDTAVQAVGDIGHELIALFADDVAHTGVVDAVQHKVNDLGHDKHCNDGVHCRLNLVEDSRKCDDYKAVGYENNSAKVEVRKLEPYKLCNDVRAARGRTGIVDDAETETLDGAADYTRKQHIVCRRYRKQCKKVDEHRREQHADERADNKARAEIAPRYNKQRDIENDGEQHFMPIRFSKNATQEQINNDFESRKRRDKIKDNYCKIHNIPLYRMEVPFRGNNKWSYEDYYRYINIELKDIVNLSRGGSLC